MSTEETGKIQTNNSQSTSKKPNGKNPSNNHQGKNNSQGSGNDRNDENLIKAFKDVAKDLDAKLESAVKVINSRISDLEISHVGAKLDFTGGTPTNQSTGTSIDPDFLSDRLRTVMPKNLRRQTLSESVDDTKSLDPLKNETVVTLTRVQPDYSHIVLKDLVDFKHVLWFINQIIKYKSENGITLPIRNLLSTKARGLLIARFRFSGIESEAAYYELSNGELTDFIYTYIAPKSFEQAHAMLSEVKFKLDNYVYTATNGDTFFENFIMYQKEFLDVAAIVAYSAKTGSRKSFMPPCTRNPMGSLSIIMKALNPNGKSPLIENILNKEKSGVTKQWADDPFGHVKVLEYLTGHLDEEAKRALANKVSHVQATTDFRSGVSHASTRDSADPRIRPRHTSRFNHISREHDSDEEYEHARQPYRDVSRPAQDDDTYMDMPDSDEAFEQSLNALQTPNKQVTKTDQPNGCFKMTAYGTCVNGAKCKFSHDPAVLTRTCMHWVKVFQNSTYFKSQPFQPRTLAHTHQSPSDERAAGDY